MKEAKLRHLLDKLDEAGLLDVRLCPRVEGHVREVGSVPPHRRGLDDDAVHERAHPRHEVLDVSQAADLPAAEHGHERLGGHGASHLEGAAQDGVLRLGKAGSGGGGASGACWSGYRAREAVLAARRDGGALGGEERGGGGRDRSRGREGRVGHGGGVLEARGRGDGGGAAAGGGTGGVEREREAEAEVIVRESGGHWSVAASDCEVERGFCCRLLSIFSPSPLFFSPKND